MHEACHAGHPKGKEVTFKYCLETTSSTSVIPAMLLDVRAESREELGEYLERLNFVGDFIVGHYIHRSLGIELRVFRTEEVPDEPASVIAEKSKESLRDYWKT